MTMLDQAAAPQQAPAPRPHLRGNPWMPTPRGTMLSTRIELLRRRPTVKGWIVYGLLVLVIAGLGVLLTVVGSDELDSIPMELILVMVLGAGMLIAPSLSATSINGDSSEGVLAPLQMTRLTAGDLAVGKLLASWFIAFAVLVTITPFLLYAFMRSGWHWDELLIVLGAILLVVLTATAVGLAWSSLAARSAASVSLAHLTTGFLLLGTLLLFLFTQPLVSEPVTYTQRFIDWSQLSAEQQEALDNAYMTGDFSELDVASIPCSEESWDTQVAHTERTAWLLLSNPVVMIGEMSPIVSPVTYEEDGRAAPGLFAEMHRAVSDARIGPADTDLEPVLYDECADLAAQASGEQPVYDDQWEQEREEAGTYDRAPWIGLGVQIVVFLGSMWIVIRRLRVPYKKLRTGTRVA